MATHNKTKHKSSAEIQLVDRDIECKKCSKKFKTSLLLGKHETRSQCMVIGDISIWDDFDKILSFDENSIRATHVSLSIILD